MDTSRIVINTIDNSTSLIEETKEVTGFTVVKAPKGPRTPVKISSGSAAKIKDIFGVSSADYPELFELEIFNKEYDTWVSAPYEEAKVPAAYITGDGVFPSATNISYEDSQLEPLILGEKDASEVSIEGLTSIGSTTNVLVDTRYPFSYHIITASGSEVKEDIADSHKYPEYIINTDGTTTTPYLLICTGLTKAQFFSGTGSAPILTKFRINNLDSSITIKDFEIGLNEQNYVIKCGSSSTTVGYLGYISSNSFVKYSTSSSLTSEILYLGISGADAEGIISQSYVKNNLDSDEERSSLLTYWIKTIAGDKVKGVIIPKFPSTRALHIDFNSFSKNTGYDVSSVSARNILKMNVYEDDAFHNASHKVFVKGSLNSKAVDGNGAVIGFNEKNSTYSNQDLIYVHCIGTIKDFSECFTKITYTEGTETKTKYLSCYPPIVLQDGTRTFPYVTGSSTIDTVKLHDYGWDYVANNDYSDVDVFFDSEVHSTNLSDVSKSKFFNLAKANDASSVNALAGYIFNFTPASVSNDLQQLSFGRNYWDVCNIAITDLDNGDRIFSPMTGARSLMQCRIIENRWGGIAPMWENQGTPSMGGQLKMITPYRLKHKYNKSELDILDDCNFNPVINDRQYGIMVVGQKTCKDGEATDWSYIGHTCSFFTFLKKVRSEVMIPQIGKANNPYYRTLRKEQVERYLSERLSGNNRIWAEGEVDTSTADGVNDVYALKAKKFVINIRVKVDIYSETVELNFTNEDQATSISTTE